MIQKKLPLYMQEKDLGELYTYLELFGRVYDGYDGEVEKLRKGIEAIYAEEYQCRNAGEVLKRLRNPREAGRKQKYEQQQIEEVRALAHTGRSIREIAEETGVSRSSVQRWIRKV